MMGLVTKWFWWCWGPVNVWRIAREYKKDAVHKSWGWNDHVEHCPRCGRYDMTEHAYEDLRWAQEENYESKLCRCVDGGSPAHYEYGGSWWVMEITCDRCGHKYEHSDSSC
jgi:hypothetical protein